MFSSFEASKDMRHLKSCNPFPTMKTAITTGLPPTYRRALLRDKFCITPSIMGLSNETLLSISRPTMATKCSRNGGPENENRESLKDLLSDMVDNRVELLLSKEENRVLLQGLEQATQRVENARRELAEIERQEIEAGIMKNYVKQLESRASEIAECQKEILEARLMVEQAERSLTEQNKVESIGTESEVTDKDKERLESIKAASIAAFIGILVQLPISLTQVGSSPQLILPLAITFVSCALFGVTFRYAVRRDLDNFQLKSGTAAAFGLVKGLGALEVGTPLEQEAGSILSHTFDGAVYISESLLIFSFATVALDFCINVGILSPFPIDRALPRT
ncbi:hypothetical protein F511_07558 [Dorcoceras hygrometricum]|uniref:Uncharacterized protein n=1 Tax=Dorcoceras hygrometricum TaxID=472368 RepID=A0A2Z7D1A2_9LAMI|nr:hypothetical protein F511_07558 [Dorcoceras hygrometricum]